MSTRQTTPGPNPAVLVPPNILKRALSEDADCDAHPDTKKVKRTSENTPNAKDKRKRKKKKKKTPVVAPLELTTGSANATPAPNPAILFSPTPTPPKSPMNPTKGKHRATSAPSAAPVEAEREAQEPENLKDDQQTLQVSDAIESSSATIARLKQELSAQSISLKKHETALAQLSQSLTCQICLDLLHKPYALAPCGHVACYNCLVSWFTNEPEHHFLGPRKKTCPHCRATIRDRPVEVWSVKDMVTALVKSGLAIGLSVAPPPPPALPGTPQRTNANNPPDLWHNIFRSSIFRPQAANGNNEQPPVEDMGMLDMEDGGVYRCLDCMHEIWDGVCTSCNRVYPGHRVDDADFFDGEMFDDDSDLEDWRQHFFPINAAGTGIHYEGPIPMSHFWPYDDDDSIDESIADERSADDGSEGYDSFIDDGDDDDGGLQRAAAIIEVNNSDSDDTAGRHAPITPRIIELTDSDDEDEPVRLASRSTVRRSSNHVSTAPRGRTRNRILSPSESSDVIVVNDNDDRSDDDSNNESDASQEIRGHAMRSRSLELIICEVDDDEDDDNDDVDESPEYDDADESSGYICKSDDEDSTAWS
ncbi:hypothetical protein GGX14DRAFT_442329 [Mycena pura]|uniref:RING-type domain-containing protein n=1 Tax=Mycena pura TaxID=153505 RepID=A0AAD6VLQ5_9AGAR|nr:hypothetical protein GGX14DRAFT_442329 [Mycena pura]